MSTKTEHPDYQEKDIMIREGGPWSGAWKVAAGIGGTGILLTAAGAFTDKERFAFAYLYAFCAFLMIALGGLFFVIVQHLAAANWSVTVRRTAEFMASGLPVFAVLAVPVFLCFPTLCPMLAPERTGGKHAMLAVVEGSAYAQPAPAAASGAAAPKASAAAAAPKPSAAASAAPAGSAAPAPSASTAAVGVTPAASGIPAPTAPHGDEEAEQAHEANEAGKPVEHAEGAANDPHDVEAGKHVAAAHHEEHDPHHVLHEATLAKKAGWFAPAFFYGRAVFYLAVWTILGLAFFRSSVRQDKEKGAKISMQNYGRSPGSLALFALTLTFAMFDWVMALDPSWFSTIFGIIMFATGVVSSLTVIALITLSLRDAGYLREVVTVEHYHDLGKLLFGFNVFWAYVSFSQFMLIWYAALPEETTYYHTRWDHGPWASVSILVLVGHFIVPLFLLMSRNVKRDLPKFRIGLWLFLPFHFIEWYWLVMPNLMPVEHTFHWVDFTALMAVGGTYFAVVFHNMTKHPLIPVGDPRLARSIHFQNA